MGFKLAMPQFAQSTPAQAKSEPSALAQTHARLKAWWNGETVETKSNNSNGDTNGGEKSEVIVDWATIHPRASSALWGNGRSFPSNAELESQLVLEAGGAKASRIALFGGGTGAMARVVSDKTAGKIEVFENDPTARMILEKTLKASKHAKRFGSSHR